MITFDQFYRKYGIRKVEQLLTPPLPGTAVLDLPRRSMFHYIGSGVSDYGPPADDYLFRNITKPIMVGHVTENGDHKGEPRRLSVAPEPLIRAYHVKNRRLRRMKALETAARDERTLVGFNYALIPRMYRYQRSFYAEYYRWWNVQAAVWNNVGKVAAESDRNQFIIVNLPKVLPSLADFKLYGSLSTPTQKMMKVFNNGDALFLLEVWKWLGKDRANSLLSKIDKANYGRVNLLFMESGRWFAMNLGVVNSWRKATAEELEKDPEASQKGFEPEQIQKRFLRLAMALFEVRTVAPAEHIEEGEEKTPDTSEAEVKRTVVVQPVAVPHIDPKTGIVSTHAEEIDMPEEASGETESSKGVSTRPEDIVVNEKEEAEIEADLAALDNILADSAEGEAVEVEADVDDFADFGKGVVTVCNKLADDGLLSAAEYRRYSEIGESYKKIPAPDGKGTLADFVKVPPETLQIQESPSIKDIPTVLDKSMLKSSLLAFDERYVKEVLQKDVAGMVLSAQRAGIAVTDYKVERIEDVMGSYDSFTVKLAPIEGTPSTWRFTIPVVNEEGVFTSNGVKYRLRKQRGDLPIRKIGPDRVALTSYYGKLFISRSTKRVNNYAAWLTNSIMALGLDDDDTTVTDLHPSKVFDPAFECPRMYSMLAQEFRGFTVAGFELNFDHTKRAEYFTQEILDTYEKDGAVVVGENKKSQILVMDQDGHLYIGAAGELVDFSSLENLLKLDASKAPVDFAEMKVFGKTVPVGFILAYEMGLEKLIKSLGVSYRRVSAGQRLNLESHEYPIVFSDETLVFLKDDRYASLILAGLNEYHRGIRQYSVYEFDKKGVYLNVLESTGLSARHLREINQIYQMFIDPITRDLLVEMGEPTTFRGLLNRSTEMLLTDTHPDELDPAFMRIKGYERFAGSVYTELVKAIRVHNGRPGKARVGIEVDPYAVRKAINQDPAIALVSEINPVQNLKEVEAVTYGGVGGRSGRSMTKKTRIYHENDMGTISESTVDSGDVAINIYTSADPQFTSLRGITKRYDLDKTGVTALLSTSALLSVGATNDDPKRVNFIAIQHGHGVACKGYHAMPVRTGYEQVLPHRTGDLFAYTARQPGKVVSVTDEGIVIEYENGELKGIELGRRFGHAAGLTIPHAVITKLKAGDKFKVGDAIAYNEDFFEPDVLNPKQLVWKAGTLAKTAIFECPDTLEDSSVVSREMAEKLTTKMTKVRTVVVNFEQAVRNLVKVGNSVEAEDILCTIEDAITANTSLFDEETLDTLKILGAQTPQAKMAGVVERVEVFYHGDKEDMSESLRAIANAGDRELSKRSKSVGKEGFTGSVDSGFRVEGDPLPLDCMAIRIYISTDVPMGVGDKGVFANQMKTVIGRVMEGENKTESGMPIDAIFSYKSISDRIVLSPEIIGTTTTLLDVIAKLAVSAYKGK